MLVYSTIWKQLVSLSLHCYVMLFTLAYAHFIKFHLPSHYLYLAQSNSFVSFTIVHFIQNYHLTSLYFFMVGCF